MKLTFKNVVFVPIVSVIAVVGIAFSWGDNIFANVASIIGSAGWFILLYWFPGLIESSYHRAARLDVVEFAIEHGYCPAGRKEPFDPKNIHSKCRGASRAKCIECTVVTIGDKPPKHIYPKGE